MTLYLFFFSLPYGFNFKEIYGMDLKKFSIFVDKEIEPVSSVWSQCIIQIHGTKKFVRIESNDLKASLIHNSIDRSKECVFLQNQKYITLHIVYLLSQTSSFAVVTCKKLYQKLLIQSRCFRSGNTGFRI